MIFGKGNIERLYERYARKLYNTSLRITADAMEAEEAMHDAFIKYHLNGSKDRIDNIEAWLTRVCIRNSIDRIRRRRTGTLFLEEVSPAQSKEIRDRHDEDSYPAEYSVEKIREAVLGLADGYRLILSLVLFEGFDYEEVAQITGLKEGSVRSQYMRAKKKLSETLNNK